MHKNDYKSGEIEDENALEEYANRDLRLASESCLDCGAGWPPADDASGKGYVLLGKANFRL